MRSRNASDPKFAVSSPFAYRRIRPITDISAPLRKEHMRAVLVSIGAILIGPASLQVAAAQSTNQTHARLADELVANTRCNLATTYRLAGGQTLNVRLKPSRNSSVVARLDEGRIVYVCDQNGDWLNVYFGGIEGPCFRTYEWGLRFREARKCKSGWVHQNWVNISSG